MSLAEQLDAIRASAATRIPADRRAVMEAATHELRASHLLDRLPKPGTTAPDFTLEDDAGQSVSLAGLRAAGPVVLSFYRGVWCPYCNADLKALDDAMPAIRAAGAQLVAISPQSAANSRKARREAGLGFPILSDRGNEVAARYSLRFRLPDALEAVYRGLGIDLPRINGEDSWTLPVPARFVIAPDGTVVYAEADPDYRYRPEPEAFLAALASLTRQAA